MWIYIGKTTSNDKTALIDMLENDYGVKKGSIKKSDIDNGGDKVNGYYYWRIESTTSYSGGCLIDNYSSGKANYDAYYATFEVYHKNGPTGLIKVKKLMADTRLEQDDRLMSGVKYTIKADVTPTLGHNDETSYNSSIMSGKSITITTGSNGEASTVGNLPIYKITNDSDSDKIKYTITESSYDSDTYVPYKNNSSVTTTLRVRENETDWTKDALPTTVTNRDDGYTSWANVAKRGDLKIVKQDENGKAISDVKFRLVYRNKALTKTTDNDGNITSFTFPSGKYSYADTNATETIDKSGKTNSSGALYFCNFPVGEYYLIETLPTNYTGTTNNLDLTYTATGKNATFTKVGSSDTQIVWRVTIGWDNLTQYNYKNVVTQSLSNSSYTDSKGDKQYCKACKNITGEEVIVVQQKMGCKNSPFNIF